MVASAFGRGVAVNPIVQAAARYALPDLARYGRDIEASFADLCKTLDGFLYNTIFEELGPEGFDIVTDMDEEDIRPRGLKNPVSVIVGFYVENVLTGRLVPPPPSIADVATQVGAQDQPDGDLWVEAVAPALIQPVADIWRWSNLDTKKPEIARNCANYGNCLLVVSEEAHDTDPAAGKVFIEVRHPADLVDYRRHRRGHLTMAKVNSTETEIDPRTGQERSFTLTRVYTKETIATFRDNRPYEFYPGQGHEWPNPHGFVPVVMIRHQIATGDDRGLNAYHAGLSEIIEMCLVASIVGSVLGKNISPQWAFLGADAPSPSSGAAGITRGDNVWYIPNATAMEQVIGNIDVAGAYTHINSLWDTLETKFPEMLLPKVGDQKRDISGAAVRGIMTGLITRGLRARENYEAGLVDALQMAISMGMNLGGTGQYIWADDLPTFGTPERVFGFHWPDILPLNKLERLKLRNDEMAVELNIVNLQLQIVEAKRRAAILDRLVGAPVDPITGLPVDPLTGYATDPNTLMVVIPQPILAQTPVPGTVGPGSDGGAGSNGQPAQ